MSWWLVHRAADVDPDDSGRGGAAVRGEDSGGPGGEAGLQCQVVAGQPGAVGHQQLQPWSGMTSTLQYSLHADIPALPFSATRPPDTSGG